MLAQNFNSSAKSGKFDKLVDLPIAVLEEFRESAIPDRLTLANIEYLEGDSLIDLMTEVPIAKVQKSASYVTAAAARIRARYACAAEGGWVGFGTTIDGGFGAVPYVKLNSPRIATEFKGFGSEPRQKPVKYDGAEGCEALPILPWVDDLTAQAIYDRYKITPLPGETFWGAVLRRNMPLVVTEGLKKALALIAHGYPAIAIRGVTQWHRKGDKDGLHSGLAEFATQGRQISICFDQDSNPKTIHNVRKQIKDFGAALESKGCAVKVWGWLASEGKGIDDALYLQGQNAQSWCESVAQAAKTLKDWQKQRLTEILFDAIDRAKKIAQKPIRETAGDYLPEISVDVIPGKITAISAATGCGKSTAIAKLAADWKATQNGNLLYLVPLNSIGLQNAEHAEIPHVHEWGEGFAQQQALAYDISYRHGLACCFDSLHRIPRDFFNRPVLLVLDEVNQGLDHLTSGATLGSRHAEILDLFAQVAKQSAAIVVAEAAVYPASIELLETLSGKKSQEIRHDREVERGKVSISSKGKLSGLLSEAIGALKIGKRFIWVTDSLRNTRQVERLLLKQCPGKTIIRIDSETNREGAFDNFFNSPDSALDLLNPDVLILSPSAKTGVSITWPGFDRVYGFFTHLDPDSWLQILTRYRLPVPRNVYAPAFVNTEGDQSLLWENKILARQKVQKQAFLSYYQIKTVDQDDQAAALAEAVLTYHSKSQALRGQQKAIAYDCLVKSLATEGFEIQEFDRAGCKATSELIKIVREELDREDSKKLGESESYVTPEGQPDTKKAYEVISKACSLEDELQAKKTIYRDEFPGISFDHPEENYWIIYQQRGSIRRGVRNQALAENLKAAKEADRPTAETAIQTGLLHSLPRNLAKATLLDTIGILSLVGTEDSLSNSDELLTSIQQKALQYRGELKYYFGYSILPEYKDEKGRSRHTPADVASKLLGAFGLTLAAIGRPGTRGSRDRLYRVALDVPAGTSAEDLKLAWEYRRKALAACQERLNQPIESSIQKQTVRRSIVAPPAIIEPETLAETVIEYEYHETDQLDPYGYDPEDWGVAA